MAEVEVTDEFKGRIGAQTAKQVIFQKVREAERDNVFAEYSGRVNEGVNGIIKRQEMGDFVVDLGRAAEVAHRGRAAVYLHQQAAIGARQARIGARQAALSTRLAALSLEGIAQNITCPIFIVNGRLDRIVPAADAEALAAYARALEPLLPPSP